jgi:hypothetical protein
LRLFDQRIDSDTYSGAESSHHTNASHSFPYTWGPSAIAKKRTEHAESSASNHPVSCTIAERIGVALLDL